MLEHTPHPRSHLYPGDSEAALDQIVERQRQTVLWSWPRRPSSLPNVSVTRSFSSKESLVTVISAVDMGNGQNPRLWPTSRFGVSTGDCLYCDWHGTHRRGDTGGPPEDAYPNTRGALVHKYRIYYLRLGSLMVLCTGEACISICLPSFVLDSAEEYHSCKLQVFVQLDTRARRNHRAPASDGVGQRYGLATGILSSQVSP